MKSLEAILAELQSRADCHFLSGGQLPTIPPALRLPTDLVAFYQRFSEARLFGGDGEEPSCRVLRPDEFVQVGEAIMGEPETVGIEHSWFALIDVQDGNYLGIDLSPQRLGRCYDCFHETYGEPGYCTVVALSFTELLQRIAEAEGEPFWLADGFSGHGDAYDHVGE
jgi:hypothetical protein